jgi:hypothetical protein
MTKYIIILIVIIFIILLIPYTRYPVPHNNKLFDFSNISNTVSFKCPQGDSYFFVFSRPKYNYVSLTGSLTIYHKGIQIHKIMFDPNQMRLGSWLDREGLESYIINSEPNTFSDLDSYLKNNEEYEIKIDFKQMPPDNTTLWLHYLETKKVFGL